MRFADMSRLITPRVFLLIVLSAFTAGCGSGGGGGDSSSTPTPSSSDWDSLIWDQDDWA